jgi:hypothetical protein
MAFTKTLPLDERVNNLRAEIDAFIDARVAEIAKGCPGVPAGVIRNTLVRAGCQCDALLQLKARDAAEALIGAA